MIMINSVLHGLLVSYHGTWKKCVLFVSLFSFSTYQISFLIPATLLATLKWKFLRFIKTTFLTGLDTDAFVAVMVGVEILMLHQNSSPY